MNPLPFIKPSEPTLTTAPPRGEGWSHELKWDGWRLQIHQVDGDVQFFTRRGNPLVLPTLSAACRKLRAKNLILDAELVACDSDGRCDIALLRKALARHDDRSLVLRCFDLLHLAGDDWRPEPLVTQQARLHGLISRAKHPQLLPSIGHAGDPTPILAFAEAHRLEGIVSKRLTSRYRSGKTRLWLKVKTDHWKRTRAPQI